jgi:lysozyme
VITIEKLLAFEEGYREKPYYCSEGYPTIGIGKRIGAKGANLSLYQFSCSISVANAFLEEDINLIKMDLKKFKWYKGLDDGRKIILISMCYQLGVSGLLKFKKMIKAIENCDFIEAEKQALDSKWAKQTPVRAARHARVIGGMSIESVYSGVI